MKSCVLVAADFVKTGGMDRANYALGEHLADRAIETHLVAYAPTRYDACGLALQETPELRIHIRQRLQHLLVKNANDDLDLAERREARGPRRGIFRSQLAALATKLWTHGTTWRRSSSG